MVRTCIERMGYLTVNSFENQLSIDKQAKTEVIQELMTTLIERYILPDVAQKIYDRLHMDLQNKIYDRIDGSHRFAFEIDKVLQEISNDKHLHFSFDPHEARKIVAKQNCKGEEAQNFLEQNLMKEMETNFGFHKIEILEGNIGYLDLRRFYHTDNASETAVAAMNFLVNSDAIIIDLRKNRGGEPEMVQLMSSYFLRGRTPLNYIERRPEGKTEQYWTLPHVPGKRMLETELYLLTSDKTFSAAEGFIYGLKCLRRATIIGETTKGGAHPVDFFALQDRFVLMLPTGRTLNPISGKNWEAVGIEPDVKTSAEKAFNTAYRIALENLIHKTKEKTRIAWLQLALDELIAKLTPVKVDKKLLQSYTGLYEKSRVALEESNLYFEPEVQPKIKLIPMTETLFALEGTDSVRIRFITDDSTNQIIMKFYYKEDREILSKSRTK